MPMIPYSEQEIGAEQLDNPLRDLTSDEVDALWRCFCAIEKAWSLDHVAKVLRSQWLDLIEARMTGAPSYAPEFINAAAVWIDLEKRHPDDILDIVFFKTITTDPKALNTRLEHAKYFVINDFIRSQIMLGGFRQFGGRNYRGFMGGSRFGDTPPVRTGAVK